MAVHATSDTRLHSSANGCEYPVGRVRAAHCCPGIYSGTNQTRRPAVDRQQRRGLGLVLREHDSVEIWILSVLAVIVLVLSLTGIAVRLVMAASAVAASAPKNETVAVRTPPPSHVRIDLARAGAVIAARD